MVFPEIQEEVYNEATGQFEPVKEEKEKNYTVNISATAGVRYLKLKKTQARKLLRCLTQSRIHTIFSDRDPVFYFEIPKSDSVEENYLTKAQAEKLANCLKPLDLVATQIKKLEEVV